MNNEILMIKPMYCLFYVFYKPPVIALLYKLTSNTKGIDLTWK